GRTPGEARTAPGERMLRAALGVVALLGLAGSCIVPEDTISRMLQHLESSASTDELPNPSILLALNLAGAGDSSSCKQLLQQLKETAVERASKDMTSGDLALYTLALLSSCQDPQQVQALGHTIDLLNRLQEETDQEMVYLGTTTFYQFSLDILALCLEGTGSYEVAAVMLAKEVLNRGSGLSVDTRAVAALALTCAHNRLATEDLSELRELLQHVVTQVASAFLDEQEQGNGMIGNIYSMGLALQVGGSQHPRPSCHPQALTATAAFYAPREWDCTQAFSVVFEHDLQQPMAIAQVLPALLGRTYLDATSVDCTAKADQGRATAVVPTTLYPPPRPSLTPPPSQPPSSRCPIPSSTS
uniref:Cobalamin binding intrinsic factor n=1 Tax=Dromaius novaehollandiae TaxID=8790 RepID=A0A8C4KS56_DRONO